MPHDAPKRTAINANVNANASASATDARSKGSQPLTWALAVWVIVLAATMLSFYVHLLNAHVQRNERARAVQPGVAAESLALRTAAR